MKDFQLERNKLIDELNALSIKYSDFTDRVSPKQWRLTGHHVNKLFSIAKEMNDLTEITSEEMEVVKKLKRL